MKVKSKANVVKTPEVYESAGDANREARQRILLRGCASGWQLHNTHGLGKRHRITQSAGRDLRISQAWQGGRPHEKTESACLQAMAAAKWPIHYIGTDALSGASRSVFFIPYDSFETWEKDPRAPYGNATLAAHGRASSPTTNCSALSVENNVFHLREDLSYNADKVNVGQMRYFEATAFRSKPGHEMEWEEIAKMYAQQL